MPVDRLSSKHYVTVIFRLLLDEHDRLVGGEVVDTDGQIIPDTGAGQALFLAVQALLARQRRLAGRPTGETGL